jgi:hypothetical protein
VANSGTRPLGSGEKAFTMLLILVGVATAAYTFGVAIGILVEGYRDGTRAFIGPSPRPNDRGRHTTDPPGNPSSAA